MTAGPRAVLLAVAAATVLALLVAASTSGVDFGAYNPRWDGASDLRTLAGGDARVSLDAGDYATVPPTGAVAVVLSPDRPYEPGAARRVRAFVRAGGTLVVAEDFGPHANDLLAAVGADARVDGTLLRDERAADRTPAMPVVTNLSDHALTAGVERLTLNHGTAVRPGGATVLASASGYAYPDADRDGVPDPDEPPGPHPVATVERVGDGRVVVLGDPSVVVNAMLDRPGNRRFAENLLSGADVVLLDYSRAERPPPAARALLVLRRSPLAGALVGTAGVAVLVAWSRRAASRSGTDTPDPGARVASGLVTGDRDALVAYLRERHPGWSHERAARVVDAVVDDPAGEDRPGGGRGS